ncbi:tetratricopeptide repeat protein [Patescibacteria group bacterium]
MLKKKNFIIYILIIFTVATAVVYFCFPKGKNYTVIKELEKIKQENSEMSVYVDNVINELNRFEESEKEFEKYLALGLAWKGLADRTMDNNHYQQALNIYESAIDSSERKNMIALMNAGNMSVYLGDYQKAEKYYNECVNLAPGDVVPYLKLMELYRYKMKKNSDEIVQMLDRGIKKMFYPLILILRKASYLKEIGQYEEALKVYNDLVSDDPESEAKYGGQIREIEDMLTK